MLKGFPLIITTVECDSLQNFLHRFSIKRLSFGKCLFSVESFSILCDSITAHNSLTFVEFRDCRFFSELSPVFSYSYSKRNLIGPEGARALAEALKVNSTITHIKLEDNSIGPEGARALAEILKVNSTITHINLEDNSIGPEGARALAEVLKVNSTITLIYQ
ncbi:hypothetical protein GEMRC1_013508 [Eukaryota sp. GEM-RC1]